MSRYLAGDPGIGLTRVLGQGRIMGYCVGQPALRLVLRRAFAVIALSACSHFLTIGAARAQSLNIPLNLTLFGTNDPGPELTINIGIGGQAPRPYIFDTGSSLFVANYTQAAFGSVPSSSNLTRNLVVAYGNGSYGYYANLVGVSSLTFYPSYTSTSGGVSLNATSPSGASSQFVMSAITGTFGHLSFPEGALPGSFPGDQGTFGAGNFISSYTTTGGTTIAGPGGILGQALIPGTTAGYVVAANGQPLSAMNGADPRYSFSQNGPQVSQNVTSCSPCVMLGLTPALIAQFMPVNQMHTNTHNDGTFANSNTASTIEEAIFLNVSATPPLGTPTTPVLTRSLLDTGTQNFLIGNGIAPSNYSEGGVLTISGSTPGATTSSYALIANHNDPAICCTPYFGQPSSVVGGGPESTIGIGFFLTNSVLYNLAGQAVGYTSNFVTDVNITTTPASPLVIDANSVPLGLAGVISGDGPVRILNNGSATLSGTNTYTGPTIVNDGFLALVGPGSISMSSGVRVSNSGIFDISGVGSGPPATAYITSLSSADNLGLVQLGANQLVLTNANGTFAGSIADGGIYNGTGGSLVFAGGIETLTGVNTYTGGTIVLAGTLQLSGAGTLGASIGTAALFGGVLDLGRTTQTFAALLLAGGTLQYGNLNAPILSTGGTINGIGGAASLTTFSGITFALGANTYTGGTTVNGGVLDVIGSLTDPTVNLGGVLMGTGTVGATTINNGGVLAPGNPTGILTVQGNLTFAAASAYLVQIGATDFGKTNVTGIASLDGIVVVAPLPGSVLSKQSTILTAAGGLNGAFAGVVIPNFAAVTPSLSYDPNTNVLLNLSLNYNALGNLNGNQQNVGNALTNFFNNTGSIPIVYATLTLAVLSQASGETATGSQQTTFQAMGQFLSTLLDPFIGGRESTAGQILATPYAEENSASADAEKRKKPSDDAGAACAAVFTKAPLRQVYDPHWSVWASGFGGSQTTEGNAAAGSNSATSRIFGVSAGADYLLSPHTIAGFALAGGGTNFSVANSGSGRSDLFQAGAFVRHSAGAAYVSAALAYGWQDVITDRMVVTDKLHAEFNANALSGRVEGGYRFATKWMGITPYAAGQFTSFFLPAYAESVVFGANNFALGYGAQTVTDARTELGFRTDRSFALQTGFLTLRSRVAWAHDYDPGRAIAATFQALPGASFVVNGAAQASESALTTASAEMKWRNGWSASATFEGEFSKVSASYAGKGVVRYAW